MHFLHLAMDVTPACEHCRNKYLNCYVEKSHFRVQWLFWSCSSRQLWNIRPCKACLFNQFPYFQLLTLLLCMLLFFFFPCINCIKQFRVNRSCGKAHDIYMEVHFLFFFHMFLCFHYKKMTLYSVEFRTKHIFLWFTERIESTWAWRKDHRKLLDIGEVTVRLFI